MSSIYGYLFLNYKKISKIDWAEILSEFKGFNLIQCQKKKKTLI